MIANIECAADFDIGKILDLAGVQSVEGATYQGGRLFVEGCSQAALDVAVASYDHSAEIQRTLTSERVEQVINRLAKIDEESIRPIRAKLAGTATEEDSKRLAELDAEVAALRVELQGIKP